MLTSWDGKGPKPQFEIMVDINGYTEKVIIEANNSLAALNEAYARYGRDKVKGAPGQIR